MFNTVSVATLSSWQGFMFWWGASGWAAKSSLFLRKYFPSHRIQNPKGWDGKGAPDRPVPDPEPQETQEERSTRVVRVEITPRDAKVAVDEDMHFIAVAYDAKGAPVGGIQFDWAEEDQATGERKNAPEKGKFRSRKEGNFRIIASGVGRSAEARVKVEGVRGRPGEKPIGEKPVSSRDLPKKSGSLRSRIQQGLTQTASAFGSFRGVGSSFASGEKRYSSRSATRNPAAFFLLPNEDSTGWNSDNYSSMDDPGKERGNPPGHTPDNGAGSANFQFGAPIATYDGRGIDLNLGLAYNSRLWHKAGSQITFDVDRDWPAAGWSLGFGKIVGMGQENGFMLIEPDGTRHAYSGTLTQYASYQECACKTADGSFIDYKVNGQTPANGGSPNFATAYFPNGTSIYYSAANANAVYPILITDANGNRVVVSYRNNQGPQIDQITDSLGRLIQFYYDSNNRLTAITAPGFNGGTRTAIRLHYHDHALNTGSNYGFSGLTSIVRQDTVPVIDAIYYPATATGYWFGDGDSYSSYGMLAKVIEQRGMGFSASPLPSDPYQPADQGTVSAGSMTRQLVYNYPLTPGALTDTPTYTTQTETWAAMDVSPAVTTFLVQINASPRRVEVTRPDGMKRVMLSHNNSGQFNDGLIYQDETYNPSSVLLGRSFVNWEQGDYSSPRPTRTETTDERGQKTGKEFSYGSRFNQLTESREYDYGYVFGGSNTLLRRAVNQYLNHSDYTDPLPSNGYWHHIFNLVTINEIFSGAGVRMARTEYAFDEFTGTAGLQDTPGITTQGYDMGFSPYSNPQYNTYKMDVRGNVTTIRRYANAAGLNGGTAPVETRHYDIAGNMIRANTDCCEQTTVGYTVNTQYAWPESQTRGSASDSTKQNTGSATYDFNTGLGKTATDPNGRMSQTTYDSTTLRPEYEYSPTNGFNYHLYDDGGLIVYDFAYEAGQSGGNFASRTDKYLDGHGRVHGEVSYTAGYAIDAVVTKFDAMGRIYQQTRPYGQSETAQWNTIAYDYLDRETQVTAPDGSVTYRYYNESSYPSAATPGTPGYTIRVKDPWGRERWGRFDALGRLVEVVEPDPNGSTGAVASNGLLTQYGYDTLGNLTSVLQGSQTRSFRYDSLSRMTHQKLAEREAKLNDAGQHVDVVGGAGTWSDVFSFDTRSNMTQRVEARGVKTTFVYNSDPLNRLQEVQYDKSGVPASVAGNIPNAPNVSYVYLTSGDKTRLQSLSVVGGIGNQSFSYDSEGRMNGVTQTFAGRESYPLVTNYAYDTLDRVSDVTYPQRWGISEPRKIVHHTFDLASRISGLSFDGTSFASSLVYNASSQATSINVGSNIKETYQYNNQTGLLTGQEILKIGSGNIMELFYDYTKSGSGSQKTGQVTMLTDNLNTNRSRIYTYDQLGRLKKADGSLSGTLWSQTYSYDRYGNRTGVAATGVTASGATMPSDGAPSVAYNTASNRITTSGYEYDHAGNQTRGQAQSGVWHRYRYDTAGRLAEVRNDSDQLIENFTYGATNQRLKTDYLGGGGGPSTYYVWSGGAVIGDYLGSNPGSSLAWERFYVYLDNRLIATTTSSGTQFQHPDLVGTRMITAASDGSVISEQIGLPFGTALPISSTFGSGEGYQNPGQTNPHKRRFTSYDRSDTTGLDYAMNRHYNSLQGRFTQVDPMGMKAVSLQDPQTLNLYTYCANDPINHVDPKGLFFGKLFGWIGKILKWVAIAAIIAVAVVAHVLPATWIVNLATWAARHSILSAILGINTPHFAILNILRVGAQRGIIVFGTGAYLSGTIGAVTSFATQQKGGSKPKEKEKSNGDDKAIPVSVTTCGSSASIGEYSTEYGDQWKGNNGKWYSKDWGGNQHTGARSNALGRAAGYRLLGRSMFGVGAAISGIQAYESASKGDYAGVGKSGIDIGMGYVGVAAGPYGAAGSGVYFAIDTFVGWDNFNKEALRYLDKKIGRYIGVGRNCW